MSEVSLEVSAVSDGVIPHRVLRFLLVLVSVLLLACVGCDEKKSSGSGGGSGGGGGGGASPSNQVQGPTKGGPKAKTSEQKAQKVLNQLNNYLLAIVSAQGAPADLDAAKQAVRETNSLSWPKDPWGKPYVYSKTGEGSYDLFSAGPDGRDGTADDIRPL